MMKKIFSVMLLCATVLVTSCNDNEDGNGDGGSADRPSVQFYGEQDGVAVYYDGTELKEIVGATTPAVIVSAMMGNDFYAVNYHKQLLKNGEVISGEGKIPKNTGAISGMCIAGNSFYITGSIYGGEAGYEYYCWKDGEILVSTGYNISSNCICALGTDVFFVESSAYGDITVYKNAEKLADFEVSFTSVKGIASYNGKVYLSVANEDEGESYRYVYNGTTMVKEATVNAPQIDYFNAGGNALFTQVNTADMDIFKNLDWATPITPLVSAPDGYKTGSIVTAIGEGDDTYIYAKVEKEGELNKPIQRIYCWKNSAEPVRMAADTIYALVHIPLK